MPGRAVRARSRSSFALSLVLLLALITPVLLAAACSRPDSRLIEIDGVPMLFVCALTIDY